MRITSGSLKGRLFADPPGARAHPMSDRIKNAMFNTLGDIKGLAVLDAFGGTGALAFESVSRGAVRATICETDPRVARSLKSNIDNLGLNDQVKLVEKSVYSYLTGANDRYDVIIADPPFMEFPRQKFERFPAFLNQKGTLVLSFPSLAETPWIGNMKCIKRANYGNASLAFYKE